MSLNARLAIFSVLLGEVYFYIESCSIRERGITILKFVGFGPGILFYFFILSLINNRNKFLVEALESEFFFVVDVPFL